MATNFDYVFIPTIPLHFGYKIPLGKGTQFVPKIGPMIGLVVEDDFEGFAYGPSTEFAFEIKHFVIAANFYVDFMEKAKASVFGTIGYKF